MAKKQTDVYVPLPKYVVLYPDYTALSIALASYAGGSNTRVREIPWAVRGFDTAESAAACAVEHTRSHIFGLNPEFTASCTLAVKEANNG